MIMGCDIRIIYDGGCPVCSRYVTYVRLRESVGKVSLIDARTDRDVAVDLAERGFDLDEGMIVEYGGNIYHGEDCVHLIAMLSSRSGWFNRLNAIIFRRRSLARLLYPVLRAGRNALLWMLGRKKLRYLIIP